MSMAIGRGCVSNSKGKPTTPASTKTAAPISLCLARLRTTSMLSGWDFDVAFGGVEEPRRKLKNGMVLVLIFLSWQVG